MAGVHKKTIAFVLAAAAVIFAAKGRSASTNAEKTAVAPNAETILPGAYARYEFDGLADGANLAIDTSGLNRMHN